MGWVIDLLGVALAALVQLQGEEPKSPRFQGAADVPYQIPGDGLTPIVQLRTASGEQLRLLIDTGASRSMVSQALADRLQLQTTPLAASAFELAGAGDDCPSDPPQRAELPRLMLGDLQIEGLEVLVMPRLGVPPGSDGVLGASALRSMPLLIDPSRQRLQIGAHLPAAGVPSGASRLTMFWRDHVPLLQAHDPAGQRFDALIDTGAEAVFVSHSLASLLQPQGDARPVRITGFCGEELALEQKMAGLTMGGISLSESAVIQTRNRILNDLAVEAIIGQPFLKGHRQLWMLNASPPRLIMW